MCQRVCYSNVCGYHVGNNRDSLCQRVVTITQEGQKLNDQKNLAILALIVDFMGYQTRKRAVNLKMVSLLHLHAC